MNIVAIGGTEMANRESLPIDRLIVDLADTARPKALLIPTASSDAQDYCDGFADIYGKLLGCDTDALLLLSQDKGIARISDKILSADIIYVGGGYTPRMLKIWRKLGVDELLKAAHRQGTVLAGTSAGGICWHQWGHANSLSNASEADWRYTRVRGLGLCPGLFCPHAREQERFRSFVGIIQRHGGLGIACDTSAAIHYLPGHGPRVISADGRATVSLYRRHAGEVHGETFGQGEHLPISR